MTGSCSAGARDKATRELALIDAPALKFLEPATRYKDVEIAERARRLIDQIKNGPGASLPIAAAQQLRKLTTPDALSVLLEYLAFADNPAVEDAVLNALRRFGQRDGKAEALIVAAARERAAPRRAAAGFMLGRSPVAKDRELARALTEDSDPWVRLRAAEGLLAGCDRARP